MPLYNPESQRQKMYSDKNICQACLSGPFLFIWGVHWLNIFNIYVAVFLLFMSSVL